MGLVSFAAFNIRDPLYVSTSCLSQRQGIFVNRNVLNIDSCLVGRCVGMLPRVTSKVNFASELHKEIRVIALFPAFALVINVMCHYEMLISMFIPV